MEPRDVKGSEFRAPKRAARRRTAKMAGEFYRGGSQVQLDEEMGIRGLGSLRSAYDSWARSGSLIHEL
jgi:hypothetical protein